MFLPTANALDHASTVVVCGAVDVLNSGALDAAVHYRGINNPALDLVPAWLAERGNLYQWQSSLL